MQVAQGPRNKPVPPMFTDVIHVTSGGDFDVTLSYKQMLIVVVTAVLLVAFWYLVQKTALGRAQRACEQDRGMAALLGVDVDRTISHDLRLGAALASSVLPVPGGPYSSTPFGMRALTPGTSSGSRGTP